MKSYVAVQKKFQTTIYALWKKNEAYIENYHNISINKKLPHSRRGYTR